jgi:hypothetical protein
MGRYFTTILDKITTVLGIGTRGNVVTHLAMHGLRAPQSARSLWARLTATLPALGLRPSWCPVKPRSGARSPRF